MRKVVRCPACSSCARVVGYGFVARARLWCTELDRWVDADDGRTFGECGEPGARIVQHLREEGVERSPSPTWTCARARPGTST